MVGQGRRRYRYGPWTHFCLLTEDTAQFALEPFARYDFSQFFLTGRFTLNLDNPYGLSLDEAIFGDSMSDSAAPFNVAFVIP